MEGRESLEKTGKAILKRMHRHYTDGSLDDTEFLPFVKAVIQGIADRLTAARCAGGQIEDMRRALKQYCKEQYVKGWVKNREEGETTEEAKKKGEKYFEYLFRHGRHPSGWLTGDHG